MLRRKNQYTLLRTWIQQSFFLTLETLGNKNLGQGVLDFFMADFLKMKIPIILKHEFEKSFLKLSTRKTENIYLECGIDPHSNIPISKQEPHPLPDRKALDDIIFDALGLTEEERKEVYRAVCQLVWSRISKARSVKKRWWCAKRLCIEGRKNLEQGFEQGWKRRDKAVRRGLHPR